MKGSCDFIKGTGYRETERKFLVVFEYTVHRLEGRPWKCQAERFLYRRSLHTETRYREILAKGIQDAHSQALTDIPEYALKNTTITVYELTE